MTNKRKILIIIGVILLVFFVTFILYWFLSNRTEDSDRSNTSPTQAPLSPSLSGPLIITNIDPAEDPIGEKKYGPLKLITITFNKAVDIQRIDVSVAPFHEVEVTSGSSKNSIVISPINPLFWEADILYTITVKQGVVGLDGSFLAQDVVYRIRTTVPQNPF